MTSNSDASEPAMPSARECVFAVSVLEGIEVQPSDAGPVIAGVNELVIPWAEIESCIAGVADPKLARLRVSALIRLRTLISDLGDGAVSEIPSYLRLLALPRDHALHPGPDWVLATVLGGVLDLGLGVTDLVGGRTDCVPIPPAITAELGLTTHWDTVCEHAERMAQIAAERLRRDSRGLRVRDRIRVPAHVIRPVGGVDVLSLLATRTLREALVGEDPSGSRAVAAPMRSRGWFDTSRTDPVFVGSAWVATPPVDRGLPTVLVVTVDEVVTPATPPTIDLTVFDAPPGPVLADVDATLRERRTN